MLAGFLVASFGYSLDTTISFPAGTGGISFPTVKIEGSFLNEMEMLAGNPKEWSQNAPIS